MQVSLCFFFANSRMLYVNMAYIPFYLLCFTTQYDQAKEVASLELNIYT